jgi:GT2 family glycosyltransferase
MGFPADVDVAVVAHNSRETLGDTLTSLAGAGCPPTAITVFDVASTDGTAAWLASAHPDVRLERFERNDGPNPARNAAIRAQGGRYVFLMDADVTVRPDTVELLHAALDADPVAKIGSPIVAYVNPPDTIQYADCRLHFICEAINPLLNRPLAERGRGTRSIGVAAACGLLIERAAAIEIGLFDERYFMGKDDGDFTHRMRMAGYRILEPADAVVLHQNRPRGTRLFSYQIRNRWHFMLKNYQWSTLALIGPCLVVHEALQLVFIHARGHAKAYWTAVAGLLAMLPSLPRDRAFIRRIRAVDDAVLLRSEPLVVRDDLVGGGCARRVKNAYDRFLTGYWRLVTGTVLARAAAGPAAR